MGLQCQPWGGWDKHVNGSLGLLRQSVWPVSELQVQLETLMYRQINKIMWRMKENIDVDH